jgi:hypothetical protein
MLDMHRVDVSSLTAYGSIKPNSIDVPIGQGADSTTGRVNLHLLSSENASALNNCVSTSLRNVRT